MRFRLVPADPQRGFTHIVIDADYRSVAFVFASDAGYALHLPGNRHPLVCRASAGDALQDLERFALTGKPASTAR